MIPAPSDVKVAMRVILCTIEEQDSRSAKSIANESKFNVAAKLKLEEQSAKNRAAMMATAHLIKQTWSKQ